MRQIMFIIALFCLLAVTCASPTTTSASGGWDMWSAFSPCSVTCGKGVQTRTRTCPPGQACSPGITRYVTRCVRPACTGSMSCNNKNGGCQQLCMSGDGTSMCMCKSGFVLKMDGFSCQKMTAPVASGGKGTWSAWSEYGPCSVTCGPGFKTRLRSCVSKDGKPATNCAGRPTQPKPCKPKC